MADDENEDAAICYLGELLDSSLVQYGDTRKKQAQKLGVSTNTLYTWRHGTAPQPQSWTKIGRYLGFDPVVLKAECEARNAAAKAVS